MKIFFTGGAGFIGSHLADRLVAEGHELNRKERNHADRRRE